MSVTYGAARWEPLHSDPWKDFHKQWWGDEGERRLQTARATRVVRIDQVEVYRSFRLLSNTAGVLYLHDELLLMYDRLVHICHKDSDGVVYAGSPGCGKSSALIYILLCRMAARSPLLLSTTVGTSFLFDSIGVWTLASADVRFSSLPMIEKNTMDRPWSLIDYDDDSLSYPSLNVMRSVRLFPVHAVRYERQRYRHWINHNICGYVWLMNPWNSADLIQASVKYLNLLHICLPDYSLALHPRFQRLSSTTKLDARVVMDAVNRSGPAPLDVLLELENPGHSRDVIMSALRGLTVEEVGALLLRASHAHDKVLDALFVWQRGVEPISWKTDKVDLHFRSQLANELLQDHLRALGLDASRIAEYAEVGPMALLEAMVTNNLGGDGPPQ